MKLPLVKGNRVDNGAEWRDVLPLNMAGFYQSVGSWTGFLRTADGIKSYATGTGVDRGGLAVDEFAVDIAGYQFARMLQPRPQGVAQKQAARWRIESATSSMSNRGPTSAALSRS